MYFITGATRSMPVVRLLALLALSPLARALLHKQIATPKWDRALTSFVDEIAEGLHGMKEPTVVISIAGKKHFWGRYQELLMHYKQRAGLTFAMVSLDNSTHRFFVEKGVPSMVFDMNAYDVPYHKTPRWPGREAIMRGKYEVTALLLDRGIRVVFSEMDVYWLRNPLDLQQELTGDFLVTQHQYDPEGEINVGFFIAKPTPTIQRVFRNVRAWMNSDSRSEIECGCLDQVLLDFAIKCGRTSPEPKLVSKCGLRKSEQEIVCKEDAGDVSWSYIPWKRLPHVPQYNRYGDAMTPEMQEFMDATKTAVAVHLWTGFAWPDKQMIFAYEHGFWAEGAPTPDESAAIRESYLPDRRVSKASSTYISQEIDSLDVGGVPCDCDVYRLPGLRCAARV